MSAPQRPLRPLLPLPPGQNPSSSGGTSRRKRTKIACKPCQQRKLKCDGARPTCSACTEKCVECHYDLAEGQSRHASLKRKNQDLQKDLGSTLELLWHIQHGSDADAHAIFDRIRHGEEHSTILASFSLLDLGSQNRESMKESAVQQALSTGVQSSSSVLKSTSHQVSVTPQEQQRQSAIPQRPDTATGSNTHTSAHVPGLSAPSASQIPSQPDQPASDTYFAIPDFSNPAPLAAALRSQSSLLKQAFSVALQCTAKIFHVYTQEEVDVLLDTSLREDEAISLATLCEICSIAAFGSRFSRAQIPPEHGDYFLNITKQLLEECIADVPLRAMKVCALIAMCNIVNKATAAFAYVELGLAIARIQGINERERRPDLELMTWTDSKKVLRSLLLCRGWLQSTLSYVSTENDPVAQLSLQDVEVESDYEMEDNTHYQMQVTNLTLIKASIFRRMINTEFDVGSRQAIGDSLNQWLKGLPKQMQLESINEPMDPEARVSRLYLHSFYLGGVMLVYRWILSWTVQRKELGLPITTQLEEEAALCAEEGREAAKKSAEILNILFTEGGAVRHCWLCIFQGYLSCCILLYDIVQKLLCGRYTNTCVQYLELASKSLQVLSWAGELDNTAREYHKLLSPMFDDIRAATAHAGLTLPYPGNEPYHFVRFPGTSRLHSLAQELSQMLYVPLKDGKQKQVQSRNTYQPPLEQTATSLDEIGLGVHLYWSLEFAAPAYGTICDTESAGSSALQMATRQFGRFSGGTLPAGWTTTKAFTNPALTQTNTTNIF